MQDNFSLCNNAGHWTDPKRGFYEDVDSASIDSASESKNDNEEMRKYS